jgi:lysozyme
MLRAVWDSFRPYAAKAAVALSISAAGVAGVQHYEGTVPSVYLDPVNIPTVCTGHTKSVTKADVGKAASASLCERLLREDLKEAERGVKKHVKVPVTQGQYDALVSFTFNVGTGALADSTLLRKLNAGDCLSAGAEFPRWNKAKGRVLNGLIARRAWERALFEAGCER